MPFFTLHRNFTLRTTKGVTIEFKKDESVWVPPMCVPDAVAIGAVPQDVITDVLGEEKEVAPAMTPEQRQAKLFEAFETLLARNVRGDFGANGLPANRKLEELCGFEVSNRERDSAWQDFAAKKAEAE